MKIDAHQHFWQYHPVRDSWITSDMDVIRRNFIPEDLQPVLQVAGLDGCVVVQANQSEEESMFQLKNAENHDFIKGVVGWTDLEAKNITDKLAFYSGYSKMKGFRHILQGEPQRDLMLQPDFMRGIAQLEQYNFAYDILIFPDQLPYIPAFVSAFPNQKFVIDHLAKPDIKNGEIDEWKKAMQQIAGYENVYCKLSGMTTEAHWGNWKLADFIPYLDVVTNAFGVNRLMYGSDWPVCLLAGKYESNLNIILSYFNQFSTNEQDKVLGENAIRFYNI